MMRGPRSARVVIGVAIGSNRIVVALPDTGSARGCRTSWPIGGSVGSPSELAAALTDALREAVASIGVHGVRLVVALMPPLALCRLIELPGLSSDETQRVLSRDVASYFPVGGAAQVVAARRLQRAAGGERMVLAAAAPVATIDAVLDAAAQAGCDVAGIIPAVAAWTIAASQTAIPGSTADSALVALDGHVEVLTVRRGELTALRRVSIPTSDGRAIVDALGGCGDVTLIGERRLIEPLERVLESSAVRVIPSTSNHGCGDLAAAIHAPEALAGPLLIPDRLRVREQRRATRRTIAMLAASVALVAASAGLELWGIRREIADVGAQRAALHGRVVGVLAKRDTVALLARRLAALRSAEAVSPRWSEAVSIVAAHLPRGAHLLSLRGEADSLLLDVVAREAAEVFEALTRAPGVLSVRAQGSIRREVRDDVGVERFTISVRLAPDRLPTGLANNNRREALRARHEGGLP